MSDNETGPRIKRRTVWINLPDEYEGFRAEIWVNAPAKLWNQLGGGDEDDAVEAMQRIMVNHNGWLDFDGNPYPPANDPDLWREIPNELLACVLAAAQAEAMKLPNSLLPTGRRSKRG